MKLTELTLNNYDFSATLEDNTSTIKLEGRYVVSWDDEIPIIEIDSYYLLGNPNFSIIFSEETLTLITEDILEQGDASEWHRDYLADEQDKVMHLFEDR